LKLDSGVIRFVAVGDTGALVANSTARFCGIVTGRFTYLNAIGGTTHAVRLVAQAGQASPPQSDLYRDAGAFCRAAVATIRRARRPGSGDAPRRLGADVVCV